MRIFRSIKAKPLVKQVKGFTADGIRYRSKEMADLHRKLKKKIEEGIIESFHLPSLEEEKTAGKSKLGSKKCLVDGKKFDSVMEGKYYVHLLEEKIKGRIKDFKCQESFELLPSYKNIFTGKKITPIRYIADFVTEDFEGTKRVIDIKGMETADFKLKKKMFGYKFPETEFLCLQPDRKTGEWKTLEDIKKTRRKRK